MTIKTILLSDIRIDGNTQARVSINQDAVAHYADLMRDGTVLPPIIVFFDGVDYWMADGFHRFFATSSLENRANVVADVRKGTQRDAILYSLNANVPHGLSLTIDDKRKAVAIMLADPEWTEQSDRAIARHCGCSNTFVSNLRTQGVNVDTKAEAKAVNVDTKPGAPTVNVDTKPGAPTVNVDTSEPTEAEKNAEAAHGDESHDPIKMLEEAQSEIEELQKQITAAQADDKQAEIIKWKRISDVATRRQNELMDTVNAREKELTRLMNTIRRICTAVGEEDPSKVAATVEAMARTMKASSK